MKYCVYILLILLTIAPAMAYECQDNTETWNTPCEIVTPVLTSACNVTILNINNTLMNQTLSTSPIGDGTYNFTFNYTDIATYSITLDCDNWSGTVNVVMGTEEQEPGFNLWLMVAIIFSILLFVGLTFNSYILVFMSGCIPMIMSIWIFKEGITIYGVSEFWVYPLAWIFMGIALIIIILSSLKIISQAEGYDDEGGDFE